VEFHKKRSRTRYAELVFLHAMGYADHVLHSGASEARNDDALFFMLEWDQYGFKKSTTVHITPNLYNCILWDLRVT
jgi:hypothetical protein